jgi:hypothetical protein
MNKTPHTPRPVPSTGRQSQVRHVGSHAPQKAAPHACATGANSAGGAIQANVIGGTRALHARLIALHAAEHRVMSVRNTVQGFGRAQANAAQTVQCKSSFGVDAFKVSLQPKTGGQALPTEVRTKMEAAFGTDFSDVRVHVGHEASRIGAIAYTWGTNIHFAPGHYNPHTLQGQKVLGHELWHVVQQKAGRVKNPFGGGVAVVQDHALEAEADRMGIRAAMTVVRPKSVK